jgi:LacI family transcriptional regulator, galactose operon repressor
MKKAKKHRPTIIDIARLANVSKSTVARALSDASNINPDTRKRVMRAVKAAGYERNHLAQSLRSGRSGMLGLVIPDIANPFWAEVARGAQDKAAEHDASLLVFSSDWDPVREASHLRALRQARVDGAMVNPVEDNIDDLGRFGMPVVLIGSSAERFPELSSVGSDIAQGVRLGLDHLVGLGHHQPALLVGSPGRLARTRFMRVVYDHFLERGLDPATMTIEEGEYTVASGQSAMARLIKRMGPRPICVFVANDLMALGALLAVRAAGLSCPDDVSILGFDGIPAGVFSDPGLSTIAKPARGIGLGGMALLLDSIAGRVAHENIVLPCHLEQRGSLTRLSQMPRHLSAIG